MQEQQYEKRKSKEDAGTTSVQLVAFRHVNKIISGDFGKK